MKHRAFVCAAFLLFWCQLEAQQPSFKYKREVQGATAEGWHTIALPSELYSKSQVDFRDLRLLSIAEDTTEIPYTIDYNTTSIVKKTFALNAINKSMDGKTLLVTFELEQGQTVNFIDLAFKEENFFGLVTMEGSEDKKRWYNIAENQRVFSIHNAYEFYRNGTINFAATNYRYLRVSVSADVPLSFDRAHFEERITTPGTFAQIPSSLSITNEKKLKQTNITIKLDHYRPVSNVCLAINDHGNYYRSARIRYLTDSIKTEKGWSKIYKNADDTFIASYKETSFDLGFLLTREFVITVNNLDNAPLTVTGAVVSGPQVELVAQLNGRPAFLFYGNEYLSSPTYDLNHFLEKIPEGAQAASLGPEIVLAEPSPTAQPLFQNKLWLWAIMAAIMAILGLFTFRMMSSKESVA